jgi:negative regulator of replication initiation
MSDCAGDLAVASKVDREMLEYIDSEADRLGVNRAEFIRRLFDLYRESRRESTDCPSCDETVVMDLRGL